MKTNDEGKHCFIYAYKYYEYLFYLYYAYF